MTNLRLNGPSMWCPTCGFSCYVTGSGDEWYCPKGHFLKGKPHWNDEEPKEEEKKEKKEEEEEESAITSDSPLNVVGYVVMIPIDHGFTDKRTPYHQDGKPSSLSGMFLTERAQWVDQPTVLFSLEQVRSALREAAKNAAYANDTHAHDLLNKANVYPVSVDITLQPRKQAADYVV